MQVLWKIALRSARSNARSFYVSKLSIAFSNIYDRAFLFVEIVSKILQLCIMATSLGFQETS